MRGHIAALLQSRSTGPEPRRIAKRLPITLQIDYRSPYMQGPGIALRRRSVPEMAYGPRREVGDLYCDLESPIPRNP
eukprot:335193-Rhodomonas_salina.5